LQHGTLQYDTLCDEEYFVSIFHIKTKNHEKKHVN